MDARMQARRTLELNFRKAIVNGEFELFYQPIVDVRTNHQLRGSHPLALSRTRHGCATRVHSGRGRNRPHHTVGRMGVAASLCRSSALAKARDHCGEPLPSPVQEPQFGAAVINALATSGRSAGRLELEITELVLLQDNGGAFAILHLLRGLGIKIAMDDFGIGYSSLGYLRSFPFDKIKIDESFIRDLPTRGDSVAIVRAVVGLSSSMGITTTAEGVETEEQLASLTSEGCDEFQGFLFSHARPAAEIQRMLGEIAPRIEAVA
ncbi:MAG TPA: EAL domain-containing protein [Pseudolabrys sp.]